jgi:hypothetical protein
VRKWFSKFAASNATCTRYPTAKDAKGKTAKSVAAKKGYDDVAKMIKRAIKEKREEEEEDSD